MTLHVRLAASREYCSNNVVLLAMLVALEGELSNHVVVDHGHKSSTGESHIVIQYKALPGVRALGRNLDDEKEAVATDAAAAAELDAVAAPAAEEAMGSPCDSDERSAAEATEEHTKGEAVDHDAREGEYFAEPPAMLSMPNTTAPAELMRDAEVQPEMADESDRSHSRNSEPEENEDTEGESNTDQRWTEGDEAEEEAHTIAKGGLQHALSILSDAIQSIQEERDNKQDLVQRVRAIWEDDQAEDVRTAIIAAESLTRGMEHLQHMQQLAKEELARLEAFSSDEEESGSE